MAEEQEQELEVLKAIFMEDLVEEGNNPKIFSIALWPSSGISDAHVGIKFQITYPKLYPAEVPILYLENLKGVLPEQLADITQKLKNSASENIGSQMVFSLTTTAKEWLDDLDTHYTQKKEEAKRQKEREVEEREQKRQAEETARRLGTAVTRDTFTAWSAKFTAELRSAQPTRATSSQRPTGRQLFEQDASMIMSDDVFIKKMEASLGASADEELPASPSPAQQLAFVPLPQSSDDTLLADPSNQYLFDDADDDLLLDSDDDAPKKPEKEEKHRPPEAAKPAPESKSSKPASKAEAKLESKPPAKSPNMTKSTKAADSKPAAAPTKGKSSKK